MFVKDLLSSTSGSANHTLAALGSSSLDKGNAFVEKLWQSAPENPRPVVYLDYHGVYNDKNVDIVYIGTPHSLHKMNCLDAISAGKHVLCEKPFTINAKETQEIIDAARAKGVFVMEGVYLSSRHVQMMPSSLSLITLPSCLDEVLSPLPGSTL